MVKLKSRAAFTMIELLFVIVVLGVVGGIVLETIRQYYENIYRTQEYTKRVSDADHILDQLTKYFENAISGSIVNLDQDQGPLGCFGPPSGIDLHDYTIAFVAADMDSLRGTGGVLPGWSEDMLLAANNELTALDANYTMADGIITALGSTLRNSALYDARSADVNACNRFNWDNNGSIRGYHRLSDAVNPINATMVRLNLENNATDGKRKYLLRTGYAFRVENNGDFTMYSNFRPWMNERYSDANISTNVLGQNVAHFYADYNASDFQANANVSDRGLVWHLKVCMRGLDANLTTSDREAQTICRERRVHVRY